MARPVWLVDLIKRAFPARFALARATRLPIFGHLVDRWFFGGDDLIYLPRDRAVRTVSVDEAIDRPGEMVLPSRVVEHFVEQANVHWIMDVCICRAAEGCDEYPVELGCLFLGEAALGIHPKLGRLVSKREALAHAARCREAGLVHMVGRNRLDAVWLGAGPGNRLLTICNCCPCCCMLRILPYLTPRISRKIRRMPGVEVSVTERCVGCGACADGVCFADAIRLEDGRAVIGEACRGCGRCVDVCPEGAIELAIEDGRVVDEVIAHIATLVDLD